MRTPLLPVALLAASIFMAMPLAAQLDSMRRADGPYGIATFGLARDSTGRILAGTQNGLYASSDQGRSWRLMGLEGMVVAMFVVTSDGAIGAAAWSADHRREEKGCYRSTDGGRTWSAWHAPFTFGFEGSSLLSAGAEGRAYVAAGTRAGDEGLYRSTDNGITWTGLPNAPRGMIYDISSERSFITWYDYNSAMPRDSFRYSTDYGTTWRTVSERIGPLFDGPAGMLYRFVTGHDERRLEASTDAGEHWFRAKPTAQPTGFLRSPVYHDGALFMLRYDDSSPVDFYHPDLLRSSDGGATWSILDIPYADFMQLMPVSGHDMLVATDKGVIRTSDRGETWHDSNQGLGSPSVRRMWRSRAGPLVMESESRSYYSVDDGMSWHMPPYLFSTLVVAGDGTLVASTRPNTYRSTDRGATWSLADTVPVPGWWMSGPDGVVRVFQGTTTYRLENDGWKLDTAFAVMPDGYPNFITDVAYYITGPPGAKIDRYSEPAGATITTLYRSTDGTNWRKIYESPPNGNSFITDVAEHGKDIYIVVARARLLHSGNGGRSWKELRITSSDASIRCIDIDAAGALYVATDSSVVRSVDRGRTVVPLPGLPKGAVPQILIVLPRNRLLVGTDNGVMIWEIPRRR